MRDPAQITSIGLPSSLLNTAFRLLEILRLDSATSSSTIASSMKCKSSTFGQRVVALKVLEAYSRAAAEIELID